MVTYFDKVILGAAFSSNFTLNGTDPPRSHYITLAPQADVARAFLFVSSPARTRFPHQCQLSGGSELSC